MVIAIDPDRRLPRIEELLNDQSNGYGRRFYLRTGFPQGHELRKITTDLGGDWDLSKQPDFYDVLNLPFSGGTLVIARPWVKPLYGTLKEGHQVSYDGKVTPDLEDSLIELLSEIHRRERELCSKWYLERSKDDNAAETAREMLEAA